MSPPYALMAGLWKWCADLIFCSQGTLVLQGRSCVWAGLPAGFVEASRVAFSAAEDLSPHLLTVPQDLLAYRDVLGLLEVGTAGSAK